MYIKYIDAKQAKELYQFKNIKRKLYRTNAAIWYNKLCRQKRKAMYIKFKSCWTSCFALRAVVGCINRKFHIKLLVINLKKYKFILSQLRPVSIIHTVNVLTVMTTQRMWELRSCTSTPYRHKRFVFSQASRPAVEPTQTIQWVPGTLSPGVKTPWCEAPSSAEGKNAWSYAYTPHILSWRAQGQ